MSIEIQSIAIVLESNQHLLDAFTSLKKDAERYRFLRDGLTGNEAWAYIAIEDALSNTQQEFDAQVDEAMNAD
jgi:uncharacterized protein YerC